MTPIPLRPYGTVRVPAPTGAEAAELDRRAIEDAGVPQPVLMENAGRSVASVVQRLHPRGRVLALVGAGNNGGDALVALRILADWGRDVEAILVADRPRDEAVLHGWPVRRRVDHELDEAAWGVLDEAAVILDGMLGTGIQGAPRDRQARVIRRLHGVDTPVVALDIPSGVDAGTGAVPGEAVRAAVTVAFGWPKLGTLLHPGRVHAGRLVVYRIGFPPREADGREAPDGKGGAGAEVLTPAWGAARRPVREPSTHKNAVGSLLVVAGSRGMAGAAVLASRAALRSGVGLLRVASPEANRAILQAAVPEAVFVDAGDSAALEAALEVSAAVVAGPGLGTDERAEAVLERVLAAGDRPLLLDADALNLLAAGRPRGLPDGIAGRPVLLTPHPGEMGRLLGGADGTAGIVEDPVGTARQAADRWRATVLLKGLPSVVAASGEPVLVDVVATSDLATGGMGDVLSGAAGAFLARGCDPRTAAGLGLMATGRAAARAGRGAGLLPSDVVEGLPGALTEAGPGATELDPAGLVLDRDAPR